MLYNPEFLAQIKRRKKHKSRTPVNPLIADLWRAVEADPRPCYEIAEAAGITNVTLSRLKNVNKNYSFLHLTMLAKAVGYKFVLEKDNSDV